MLSCTIVIILTQNIFRVKSYCTGGSKGRERKAIFTMENCPVTSKDKFKLETPIDDFNLWTFCVCERWVGNFFVTKTFFLQWNYFESFISRALESEEKFLKHNSPLTKKNSQRQKNLNSFSIFPFISLFTHCYRSFIIITRLSCTSYACNVTWGWLLSPSLPTPT